MKNLLLIFVFILTACAGSKNEDADKAAIIKLLADESNYAAQADSAKWASCWLPTDKGGMLFTNAQGVQGNFDYRSMAESISKMEPFDLEMSRTNFSFVIGRDVAFVSFDQSDNWGGNEGQKKKESRTLKKVDGQWKIVSSNVIDVSSFQKPRSGAFHMAATAIPPNDQNGFTNVSGIGGMTIEYVDMPRPMDFTPLLKGLPGDMCTSDHWGYVIDGSLRVIYPDGRQETFKAGEVFYMPAPHTVVIDEHMKMVDFSSDREIQPVMDHITQKLTAQATD